jgi:hypothetical protein
VTREEVFQDFNEAGLEAVLAFVEQHAGFLKPQR